MSFNISGQIYSEPYPNVPEGRNMVVSSSPFPLAAIKATRTETAALEFSPSKLFKCGQILANEERLENDLEANCKK